MSSHSAPAAPRPGLHLPGVSTQALFKRQLARYPTSRARYAYLAIIVVATVCLYYQLYVVSSVSTIVLAKLNMSFLFFVTMLGIANAIGACASIFAGLADRWGRANLVAYGLGVTALLTLVAIPLSRSEWSFSVFFCMLGFVEGIVLVATPALVRDFSPQLGRASAMGFWTLGPVVGSLIVTVVANHSLSTYHTWQSQFVICGIVSVIVFAIALLGLRELSPKLRDQTMVTLRDRALIELHARRGDVRHEQGGSAFRHVGRPRVLGSALGISIFLVIYFTMVTFIVVLFGTLFDYSPGRANGLGSWYWGIDAITLVAVGLLSDRLAVRKPFMVIGAVGTIVMTILFLHTFTHPHTSYGTFQAIIIPLSAFQAIAYAPWMASFTETVEDLHPSLTAVGLAVWGWIIRMVVFATYLVLPHVISSMNTLVKDGPVVTSLATTKARLAAQAAHLKGAGAALQAHAATLTHAQLLAQQTALATHAAHLKAAGAALEAKATPLAGTIAKVQHASGSAPHQWQHWFWVAVVCQVAFLPFIAMMRGRWSPRAARADAERHDEKMRGELERLAPDVTA
ncbi:MAG TPA: MFS transporter [Solirubrobacteraceae bacterium]|jgi:MFS family permease|nr:MFS transporter [Solirubrobacteraceae bacterium]